MLHSWLQALAIIRLRQVQRERAEGRRQRLPAPPAIIALSSIDPPRRSGFLGGDISCQEFMDKFYDAVLNDPDLQDDDLEKQREVILD